MSGLLPNALLILYQTTVAHNTTGVGAGGASETHPTDSGTAGDRCYAAIRP